MVLENIQFGAGKSLKSPVFKTLCIFLSYQSLLSDISIVWRIMSLPVHEPLTPARLQKIVSVVVTCLYAAVTVATANTVVALSPSAQTKMANALKDEEVDNYAASIVEKSVSVYDVL